MQVDVLEYFYNKLRDLNGCICSTIMYDNTDYVDIATSLQACHNCTRSQLAEILKQMNVAIQIEKEQMEDK